jgi:hypothetical protein
VSDVFVAELIHKDRYLRQRLAPAVGVIASYSERRAAEMESYELAMATESVAVPPPPPTPFKTGGPGFLGEYARYSGPVQDFAGMDPTGVRQLCRLLGGAVDELYGLGRVVHDLVTGSPALFPTDALEASGRDAFLRLCDWLKAAIADLDERARKIEMSYAAGALLGAAVPVLDALLRDVEALAVPAAMGIHKRAVRPVMGNAAREATAAAKEFADILDQRHFDGSDHAKLFAVLNSAEPDAEDPAFATAFVRRLLPDGLTAWCELMAKSVINIHVEQDILRPLSRLIGTATTAEGGLDPAARRTVLNSPCLDTLIHYGTFDADFAHAAARRILENPGRYRRVDGSHRVYAGVDDADHYQKGDARYGALRLLANHPALAQRFAEQTAPPDPAGRMLLLKSLEKDGLVGEAAAAALEAGLSDLSRKESEDTLELVIRMVAHGHLDLSAPAKVTLARLLTDQQAVGRLLRVAMVGHKDTIEWQTDTLGFRVPADTLESCLGKILDDKRARAEFLARLAQETGTLFSKDAAAVGATKLTEPRRFSVCPEELDRGSRNAVPAADGGG